MKTNKIDNELYNELLDNCYNELYDETCLMSDEEYQKALELEKQEIADSFHDDDFLVSLRLLKLGKNYKFNMENIFNELINGYDEDEDGKANMMIYCNDMYKLSNTLNTNTIKYIDDLCNISEETKNKCKDLNNYIAELDMCLLFAMYNLIDDYIILDYETLNKILYDEIKYLKRKYERM